MSRGMAESKLPSRTISGSQASTCSMSTPTIPVPGAPWGPLAGFVAPIRRMEKSLYVPAPATLRPPMKRLRYTTLGDPPSVGTAARIAASREAMSEVIVAARSGLPRRSAKTLTQVVSCCVPFEADDLEAGVLQGRAGRPLGRPTG